MSPVPEEVALFIYAHFSSVVQLEVLRVLDGDPAKEWRAADLARKVQTGPEAMAAVLDDLHVRGLVDSTRRGAEAWWRHGPRTPELAALVRRLLQLYLERPVTVIRMVYERDMTVRTVPKSSNAAS